MPASNPRYQVSRLEQDNTSLKIVWQDEHVSRYPSKSKRHIRSCSVDLDEFYSRLRIIYDERQDPRRWMTFR